jgi:hypothetical protein
MKTENLENLEIIAQQLLDVMNNKNFGHALIRAAKNQLNYVCYEQWKRKGGEVISWKENENGMYTLNRMERINTEDAK